MTARKWLVIPGFYEGLGLADGTQQVADHTLQMDQ